MYSVNYLSKFIANFREFYNEINGATLTGAIDVVVVEQPDGSFTCSPFHVRFGKLGVLRSRFKVVDLELNGEPLNIHMKLGESGEAFFVEEMPESEMESSAHLATSPIPDVCFERLYRENTPPEPRRRKSLCGDQPELENQISDFSHRRYTDGPSMMKPDFKTKQRDVSRDESKELCDKALLMAGSDQDVFEMDLDDGAGTQATPRTFKAEQVMEESSSLEAVRKISASQDFRPIIAPEAMSASTPTGLDNISSNSSGKKKKKTRCKKKHLRKSSSSSNSSQSERVPFESQPPPTDFCSDTELLGNLSTTVSDGARLTLALSDTLFEVQRDQETADRAASPPQSDTELEMCRARAGGADTASWKWGELPTNTVHSDPPSDPISSDDERHRDQEKNDQRRSGMLSGMLSLLKANKAIEQTDKDGVYLAELEAGGVAPDVAALYFPRRHEEDEYESGNGPSLPQSPAELDSSPPHRLFSDDDPLYRELIALSLCGTDESQFESRRVKWSEFRANPSRVMRDSRLVLQLGGTTLPWQAAAPQLLAAIVFRESLPQDVLDELITQARENEKGSGSESEKKDSKEKDPKPTARGYSWWSWRRTNTDGQPINETAIKEMSIDQTESSTIATNREEPLDLTTQKHDEPTIVAVNETTVTSSESVKETPEPVKETPEVVKETEDPEQNSECVTATETEKTESKEESNESEQTITPIEEPTDISDGAKAAEASFTNTSEREGRAPWQRHKHRSSASFRKTLRLSSEQIASLNLREGMNEIVFSVTTAYQGTTRCRCNIFRWRYDDKIVISDIDGTITKSDVLGHIFPLVGKDWAQSGVAQLFTKIKNNGYKLLYLSARAIGQAKVTREYLRSIKQGSVSLPDGPLLLNPTSLLRAFHREVIEKKPEEFKIQCLADIKALFPVGSNPFYAGYGNRVNDVCAYQAVGIPIVRIFTINYKGELKHELTQTFQSTYVHMSCMVDAVFPATLTEANDYNACVYWRDPLPTISQASLPTIHENST